MVNAAETSAGASGLVTRRLAIGYAPLAAQPALLALFTLDDRLGSILRTTRESMVGQMRLTWWYEALGRLDTGPAPAEPVLTSLSAEALPRGITGARLADLIDGWEVLLETEVLSDEDLARYGERRGSALFGMAAELCGAGASDPVSAAGRGWALADLARNVSDAGLAGRARTMAAPWLKQATAARWSRRGRALGALSLLAREDQPARPTMLARLILHRLTGR